MLTHGGSVAETFFDMRLQTWISVAGAALALASLLPAHHSVTARYDEKKSITVKGIVTRVDWSNPHVYLTVERAADSTTWNIELPGTLDLKRARWTRNSIKVGETVTATGNPSREGRQVWATRISVFGQNLSLLPVPKERVRVQLPVPRYPDGHVRLGPEPGKIGYWEGYNGSLFESGVSSVRVNAGGWLANPADAPKIAPFQPWALGLYKYRQANRGSDDPMASCLPAGGPRQFATPYGFQLHEDRERKRLFVFSGGSNRNWRLIYLDGRGLPDLENETFTYFGFSIGRWNGDTLEIQAAGFNERFWFSNGGLPHTESLRLTEKISRPFFDTLNYEVAIDDPGAYTRPWTSIWSPRWVPDEEVPEYFCDDHNREQLRAFEK